jgi:hypothetical protein
MQKMLETQFLYFFSFSIFLPIQSKVTSHPTNPENRGLLQSIMHFGGSSFVPDAVAR